MKTYRKITDKIIEETNVDSVTTVRQLNRDVLQAEIRKLNGRIREIDKLLLEFK